MTWQNWGLVVEDDEEREDGVVMTTLMNLAKRDWDGVSVKPSDEMENSAIDWCFLTFEQHVCRCAHLANVFLYVK